MISPRFALRPLLALAGSLLFATGAFAATSLTGTVTNKTNGKPSAGDEVTLIQLQQGMQEATHARTDAHGRFTLEVPDDGMHLVRVTHQKATYFQPVPPGTGNVDVSVYDAAPQVAGVRTNVLEMHVEANATELHVVEVLQVINESSPQRTQFGPNGFEFYLPPGALIGRTGAITQGGMPVQTPAVPRGDPGHFSFLFPLRPGETQFGIGYTLPYTGKYTFTPKLTSAVRTFAVLLPASMKLTPGTHAALTAQASKAGTQTFLEQDVAPDQAPEFTVTGTGTLPENTAADTGAANGAPNASTANPGSNPDASAPGVSNSDLAGGRGLNNPLNESGDRDPWSKYKWWILSGLALLLAAAAGVLLRKSGPAEGTDTPLAAATPIDGPPVPRASATGMFPSSQSPVGGNALLAALKEELFALETERLQQRISETEYAETRAALDRVLRRALARTNAGAMPEASAETDRETAVLAGQGDRA